MQKPTLMVVVSFLLLHEFFEMLVNCRKVVGHQLNIHLILS